MKQEDERESLNVLRELLGAELIGILVLQGEEDVNASDACRR
jgi:hypothetical protein